MRLVSGKLQRLGVKNLEKLELPTRIVNVSARGKIIFIELQGEYSLISTLGMSGWWYPPLKTISPQGLSEAYYARVIDTIQKAEKHLRLQLVAEDGSVANYIDPRNFGNFTVVSQTELESRRRGLGLDFLNLPVNMLQGQLEQFPRNYAERSKWGKQKIGEVLLDQSFLAGLGNIYRAEVMYLSKLNPHRLLSSLDESEVTKLLSVADLVLNIAYQGRGTMVYPIAEVFHYLGDSAKPLQEMVEESEQKSGETVGAIGRHLVYGCKTDIMYHEVKSETIGGRTCWWVPSIQA